jgi:hypothetical protein
MKFVGYARLRLLLASVVVSCAVIAVKKMVMQVRELNQ